MSSKRDKYFQKIQKLGILSDRQMICFKYIYLHGPITANEISDKATKDYGHDDAYATMSWNKIPSQLEDMDIVYQATSRPCTSILTQNKNRKAKAWDLTYRELKRVNKISPKVKSLISQAQNSALLAVEVYNKPQINFKSESYVTLMVIAWTKLLHAYFADKKIDYYYKNVSGKYELTDDKEKKTWSLFKCVKEFGGMSDAVQKNLEIHIKLRNRIVHGSVDPGMFDAVFFPECQAVLYNFENFLIRCFGSSFALNQSLAYSLQFSSLRTSEQTKSLHELSYMKGGKILEYLDIFRMNLTDEVYNSPEYSFRLISIPQISNSSRRGIPVEFIKWDDLDDYQKDNLSKINAIIKTKKEIKPISNIGMERSGGIIKRIRQFGYSTFNQYSFKCFCFIFSIRPYADENLPVDSYNSKLCAFDDLHKEYVYYPALAEVIVSGLRERKITTDSLKSNYKSKTKRELDELFTELLLKL